MIFNTNLFNTPIKILYNVINKFVNKVYFFQLGIVLCSLHKLSQIWVLEWGIFLYKLYGVLSYHTIDSLYLTIDMNKH